MSDTSLGTATAQIRIDGSQAASGAAQMQTAMNSLNKVVSSNWWGLQAIGNVLAGLGAAGVAAFGEAADAAANWDASMAQLNASLNGAASGTAASTTEIAGLSSSLLALGQTTAVPLADLANIANELAKVGVSASDIPGVTATIAQLGSVTGESTADMIESFGRFSATLGLTGNNIKQAGSAIFDLSRQTPATAENIAIVTDRIDGLHESAGVTTPDLLGIASAVATIAPNARTAASTINQTFQAIGNAVDNGGVKLRDFADLAGLSQAQFVAAWNKGDTTQVFTKIVQGLGQYSDATGNLDAVLKNLGLASSSNAQILGGLASAQSQFADSNAKLSTQLQISNASYKKGNDLQSAATTLYKNFAAQLVILENTVKTLAISFGQQLLPVIKPFIGIADDLATGFENLSKGGKDTLEVMGAVGAATLVASGAFFKLYPMLIQARAGIQNLLAGLEQYQSIGKASAGAALASILNQQTVATEETTVATIDEEIAQAKLAATIAAANVKQDAAAASARVAAAAQTELAAAEAENITVTEAATAASAAYADQLAAIQAMSRGQIVAAGSAAGIPKSSSTSTADLTAGLTADTAAQAAAANDAVAVSEQRLEAARLADTTAASKSVLAEQQAEVARLQAAKAAGVEADAVSANTKAIIEETEAKENSNRTPLENNVVNTTTDETTTTNTNEGSATSGAANDAEAESANVASGSNTRLAASYQRAATASNVYDAAAARLVEAQGNQARATEELAAAFQELKSVQASGVATQEEVALATEAVTVADQKVASTSSEAAIAMGVEKGAAASLAAAMDALAISSGVAAVDEDAASLGLATFSQVAGAVTLAATLGITAFTGFAGAHEKAAASAKKNAEANQELTDILTEQSSSVQKDADQWINHQLKTQGATAEMARLGITAAQVIAIITGNASSPALNNFITEANAAGNSGERLLKIVDSLATTYKKSSDQAAKLNGTTEAQKIADDQLTGADQDLNNSLGSTAQTASQLAAALDKSYSALEDLVGAEEDVTKAAESVTSAQEQLADALKKQAAQAEDVQKATIDVAKAQLALQEITQTLADDQVALGQAATQQAQETTDANKSLVDADNKLVDANNAVTDAQNKLNTAMDPTIALNAYNDAVAKLADANNSLVDSQATVASAQWNLNYLMEEGASNADIAAAQRELSDAQQKQTDDTNAIADATQDLKKTQTDQASSVVDAQASLNDAIQSQADALDNVATAQQAVTKAQSDAANNKDYTAALEKVQSDQLDLQSDTLAVTDAQTALSTAQNEGASLANAVAIAQSGLADAYLSQAQAIVKVEQDQVELSGGTWTAQMATMALLSALQQIAPTAGGAQGAIQGMINTIITNLPLVKAAADSASGGGGGGGGGGGSGGISGVGNAATGTKKNLDDLADDIKGKHIPTLNDLEKENDNLQAKLANTNQSIIYVGGHGGSVVAANQAFLDLQNQIKNNQAQQDTYRGNLSLLQSAFGLTSGAVIDLATKSNVNLSQALTRPEIATLEGKLNDLGISLDGAGGHFTALGPTAATALANVSAQFSGSNIPTKAEALAISTATSFTGSFTLANIGTNSIAGVLQEMINKANKDAHTTALAVAAKILGELANALFIKSPSKRAGDEIGAPITQGIMAGMIAETDSVTNGTATVANTIVSSAVAAVNAGLNSAKVNTSNLMAGVTAPGSNVMAALSSGTTVPVDPSVTATNNQLAALTSQLASLESALGENTSGLSDVAAGSQVGASGTASATTGDTYHFHEVQVSADQIIREASWKKRINARR